MIKGPLAANGHDEKTGMVKVMDQFVARYLEVFINTGMAEIATTGADILLNMCTRLWFWLRNSIELPGEGHPV